MQMFHSWLFLKWWNPLWRFHCASLSAAKMSCLWPKLSTRPATVSCSVGFCFNRQWPLFKMEPCCQKCFWRTTNIVLKNKKSVTTTFLFIYLFLQHDVFQQQLYVAAWHLNIVPKTPASANVWQYITFRFPLYTYIAFMQLPDIVHTTVETLFLLSNSPELTKWAREEKHSIMLILHVL